MSIFATTATDRLIANAERVIADYVEACEAHAIAKQEQLDQENEGEEIDEIDSDLEDWFYTATETLWIHANWITANGTPEQKAFIAGEAVDFDKVWTIHPKTKIGYWANNF